MRKRFMSVVLTLCLLVMMFAVPALAPSKVQAAEDTWTMAELHELLANLEDVIGEGGTAAEPQVNRPNLQTFLDSVRNKVVTAIGGTELSFEEGLQVKRSLVYALKLAKDTNTVEAAQLWTDSPFVVYEVPGLSPDKRLPDRLPTDGKISDRLSVISAQNEYEAASFLFAPLNDVQSVTFTTSDLQSETGIIPANAVDMHVVKTWYQGGTAWQSYFADHHKDVLVPELLLHDENLITVDHAARKNFLRVDDPTGSRYVDISSKPAQAFNHFNEKVSDSATLLPIALKQGESKQMWLTLKVPAGTPAGFYNGTIAITADGVPAGELKLKVRVLPFELPAPKTYYDVNKDFYVMLYHGSRVREYMNNTKNNAALVDAKLLNEYRNMAEHNAVNIPGPLYNTSTKQFFLHQLDLMRQAGLDLDPLFGVKQTYPEFTYFNHYNSYNSAKAAYEANPTAQNKQKMDQFYALWRQGVNNYLPTLDEAYQVASEFVGHTNLYFDGWDEAGWTMLQFQQEIWRYVQDVLGAKVFATGNASHLNLETPENYLNWAGEMTREKAAQWHALGPDKMITSYAHPHTGPENPDLMRQRHGLWLYKANYDATYNYIWYENPGNIWNDNYDVNFPFRAFNLVYPTQTDVIDTIAWEGFREGIDDIRYATKLQLVAAEAIASGNADRIAAANKALTWLEAMDERSSNADMIRLEMIYHIVRLLELQAAE